MSHDWVISLPLYFTNELCFMLCFVHIFLSYNYKVCQSRYLYIISAVLLQYEAAFRIRMERKRKF